MDSEIRGKNRQENRLLKKMERKKLQKSRNQHSVVQNDNIADPNNELWKQNVERMVSERDSYRVGIEDQNFLVLQYVSERTNIKNKEPCLKFKGVFATVEEADDYVKHSKPYDNNSLFDTIMVDMGTWMVMPPRPNQFYGTKIEYDHPELQKIMDTHLKHVVDDYNSVQKRLNVGHKSLRPNESMSKTTDAGLLSTSSSSTSLGQEKAKTEEPYDEGQ